MHFTEEFLYFIWQFRLFNTKELRCSRGQFIQIIHPGVRNSNAGPDFNQAKIVLDETIWAGNVEIHLKSSDWNLHGHQHDCSYESVILHVVYEDDYRILWKNGAVIPVLEIKGLFDEKLLSNYVELVGAASKFPCAGQIATVKNIVLESFISRLVIERLEQKSMELFNKLDALKGDWDETFYYFLARNFGFKVNAVPFELLASSVPQHIYAKNKDNSMSISAIIFGQAGFLDQEYEDDYPKSLKKEYDYLKKKYQLTPLNVSVWKFLRMRPQNFPTVRLAQFAALIAASNHLFSKVLTLTTLKSLYQLFEDLSVHEYWNRHYHFNKATEEVSVQLGIGSIQNIIINTVCLFLFAYGKYTDQGELTDRALRFLEEMPAERNAIITNYLATGIKIDNSFDSQALLQLNKCYCTQKKCLNCVVGVHILKK